MKLFSRMHEIFSPHARSLFLAFAKLFLRTYEEFPCLPCSEREGHAEGEHAEVRAVLRGTEHLGGAVLRVQAHAVIG